ncbi:MAG: DNA polymerase III subunit psi [Cyclobacteriaceae bacterium]|jgi:DNA polymerase III psi subunit
MDRTQELLFPEDLYRVPTLDVVLIPKEWQALPRSDQDQLYKILGALKRSPETVRVIRGSSLEAIPQADQPDRAVLFAEGFDETFRITDRGTTRCLHAPPLSQLSANKELKQKLWAALQALYSL